MIRKVFTCFALIAAVWCRAALPEAVVQACLTPTIHDGVSPQPWALMTAEAWDNGAMRITESAEVSVTAQTCHAHPMDWLTADLRITTPNQQPNPKAFQQTLTLVLRSKGVLPNFTCTLNFLDGAVLPPCEIIKWKGKLAIVSKQKDWYIVAEDPKMTITQTEEATPKTTLRLANVVLEKTATVEASITIGEGALP